MRDVWMLSGACDACWRRRTRCLPGGTGVREGTLKRSTSVLHDSLRREVEHYWKRAADVVCQDRGDVSGHPEAA